MTESLSREYTDHDFQLAQPRLRLSSSYKFMRTESNKNIRQKLEDSPELHYVKLCTQASMPPESFRLFSSQCSRRELKLNNYCMGDRYAEVVSKTFKRLPDLKKIDVKANHLTDRGIANMVKCVSYDNLLELELSKNTLGPEAITKLTKALQRPDCTLQTLKLESCGLKGYLLKKLVEALVENRVLRELSLAKNGMSQMDSKAIGDLINLNRSLTKLDLHFNGLTPNGVFEGLADNDNLLELDLSWNSMGKSPEFTELLKKVLDLNHTLRHLDISFTSLTRDQCVAIAEALVHNKTLYGLHVEGNPVQIDALGYLKCQGTAWLQDRGHLTDRMFQQSRIKLKKSRHCWICEGWIEAVFDYDPDQLNMSHKLKEIALDRLRTYEEPVFIHIDTDNWTPQLMTRLGSGIYQLKRAVPQGPRYFFFSYRGIVQTSNQYVKQTPIHSINRAFSYYQDFTKHHTVTTVNLLVASGKPCSINSLLLIQPRPTLRHYTPPPNDLPNELELTAWAFEKSIFSRYRLESEDLFVKCLEADWSNCKVEKLVKDPVVKLRLKAVLKQHYRYM